MYEITAWVNRIARIRQEKPDHSYCLPIALKLDYLDYYGRRRYELYKYRKGQPICCECEGDLARIVKYIEENHKVEILTKEARVRDAKLNKQRFAMGKALLGIESEILRI